MSEFENLVALVTGGSSGIGAATAKLLLERGAQVAVIDKDITKVPEGAIGFEADISDRASVATAIDQVIRKFTKIDILINNAGIGATGQVDQNNDEEWRHVLDVNVIGTARVTAAVLPHLRKSQAASIVNTCSVVAFVGFPNRVLYSATKGAIAAMTLAMANDFVKEKIRVNAVSPGTTDTPWVARLLEQSEDAESAAKALMARQPMGRLVTADEVAHAIAYLASPLSSSTTGTILSVDGGIEGLQF